MEQFLASLWLFKVPRLLKNGDIVARGLVIPLARIPRLAKKGVILLLRRTH
jgi:hypothetical protein